MSFHTRRVWLYKKNENIYSFRTRESFSSDQQYRMQSDIWIPNKHQDNFKCVPCDLGHVYVFKKHITWNSSVPEHPVFYWMGLHWLNWMGAGCQGSFYLSDLECTVASYLPYSSITVMQHHGRVSLWKEAFNWGLACSFRGLDHDQHDEECGGRKAGMMPEL